VALIMAMLKAGADLHAKDRGGRTVLMYAAKGGHPEVVRRILDRKADIEEEDNQGETALYHAAREGRATVIDLLAGAGARVNRTSRSYETPLMVAAQAGQSAAIAALLRAGAKPNLMNEHNKNWTAMMYAAKGTSNAVIDELASHGAHVNVEDTSGEMPIHIAARSGNNAVVRALLSHDAYVNTKGGYDRKTPLEIAVARNDRSVAEVLLERGACVTGSVRDAIDKKKADPKNKDDKMTELLDRYRDRSCDKP
jgi:ankyrin repeat protein